MGKPSLRIATVLISVFPYKEHRTSVSGAYPHESFIIF
jgi:hypothetical protein